MSERGLGMTKLGQETISRLFAMRHESPDMRQMCRTTIRDYRLWLRIFKTDTEKEET